MAALVERDLGQPVRREGRWLKWRCPFHADGKTPSLGVAGNRWKCFGCGRSGDAIDWLREREGLSFQESVRAVGCSGPATCFRDNHQPSAVSFLSASGGVAGASAAGGERLPVGTVVRGRDQGADLAQPAWTGRRDGATLEAGLQPPRPEAVRSLGAARHRHPLLGSSTRSTISRYDGLPVNPSTPRSGRADSPLRCGHTCRSGRGRHHRR